MTECLTSAQPPSTLGRKVGSSLNKPQRSCWPHACLLAFRSLCAQGKSRAPQRWATSLSTTRSQAASLGHSCCGKQARVRAPRGLGCSGETLAICKHRAPLCSSGDWSRWAGRCLATWPLGAEVQPSSECDIWENRSSQGDPWCSAQRQLCLRETRGLGGSKLPLNPPKLLPALPQILPTAQQRTWHQSEPQCPRCKMGACGLPHSQDLQLVQ